MISLKVFFVLTKCKTVGFLTGKIKNYSVLMRYMMF